MSERRGLSPPRLVLPAALYRRALTTRCGDPRNNNEELEFFGDSVVEIGVRALCIRGSKGLHEAHLKSQKVRSTHALAHVADGWGLAIPDLFRCGRCTSCQMPRKQLADVVEAIVGAMCIHMGLDEASVYVKQEFAFLLDVLDFRPTFEPGSEIRKLLADHGAPKLEATDNDRCLAVTVGGKRYAVRGAVPLQAQYRLYNALKLALQRKGA